MAAPHSLRAVSSPGNAPHGCLLPVAATHVPARQLTPPWHAAAWAGPSVPRSLNTALAIIYLLLGTLYGRVSCVVAAVAAPRLRGDGVCQGRPAGTPCTSALLLLLCVPRLSEWPLQCSIYSSTAHHRRASRCPTRAPAALHSQVVVQTIWAQRDR